MDLSKEMAAAGIAAVGMAAYCLNQSTEKAAGSPEKAGVLDGSTTSIPAVGQNMVVGSKNRKETKVLVRPPHQIPPASWHKSPDLDKAGPLSRDQVHLAPPPPDASPPFAFWPAIRSKASSLSPFGPNPERAGQDVLRRWLPLPARLLRRGRG